MVSIYLSSFFLGFRVLPSLLQRRRSPEANQTLHGVGPSLLGWYIIYTFSGALAPWQNFDRCIIHFYVQVLRSLQQRASAKLCGVVPGMELQNFRRGRHLYSAGRPSRWASAHIVVSFVIELKICAQEKTRNTFQYSSRGGDSGNDSAYTITATEQFIMTRKIRRLRTSPKKQINLQYED